MQPLKENKFFKTFMTFVSQIQSLSLDLQSIWFAIAKCMDNS
jgi:hypothetical protein